MTDGGLKAGTPSERRDDPRLLPWFASGAVLVLAVFLAAIRTANATPFEPWLGAFAFAAVFATPGIVGGFAAAYGRPSLYAAAGASCLVLAVSAFSGVTLPLLIPAVCFLLLAAETRGPAPETAGCALRTPLLAVVAGILVLIALLEIAVIAAVLAVAAEMSVVAIWRRTHRHSASPRSSDGRLPGALVVLVVAGLAVASFGVLLATTETVCWTARDTPTGTAYSRVPSSSAAGPTEVPPGNSGAGCDSGVYSTAGSAGSIALDGVAITIAAFVARPREPGARTGDRDGAGAA